MSTVSFRLSKSTHQRLKEWAEKDNMSINQFISSAVSEKLAPLSTLEYLEARAKKASRAQFEAVLAKVPDVEPTVPADAWR